MKYVIVSKNDFLGTSNNDIPNPLMVTEIATELIITRLYLLDQYKLGNITQDDTIVCIEDRKCLYTNIFKNVISYDEYKKITGENEVLDLLNVNLFNRMASGSMDSRLIPYKPFYKNWERDKDLITNLTKSDISKYDVSKPFICLVIRKRGAWGEKNMSDGFWFELIKKLKDNDIKTFVFGKETKHFCDDESVEYVENYQDWCTLVSNKNCKHISSTMSGGVYPAMIFGNTEIKLTIIDNTKLMAKHSGDPSFYDDCVNFTKVKFYFINEIPKIEDYYEKITEDL